MSTIEYNFPWNQTKGPNNTDVYIGSSFGPRPSRDSLTKEGMVSNVRFPGCESACERELCNST